MSISNLFTRHSHVCFLIRETLLIDIFVRFFHVTEIDFVVKGNIVLSTALFNFRKVNTK